MIDNSAALAIIFFFLGMFVFFLRKTSTREVRLPGWFFVKDVKKKVKKNATKRQ